MRRILLVVAALLIFLSVAIPILAVYYLAYTQDGWRFIVGRVPHKVGGIEIDIVNPSGTIAHGIQVERLEIDHHLVHLTFNHISGRIELLPLLLQTVRTKDASIGSITVQAKRRIKPPVPSRPLFLPRWLIVDAVRFHIGSAAIFAPSGARLDVANLHASALARHRTIRLFESGFQIGDMGVEAIGQLHAADPLQLDLQGRISWTPADQPAWSFSVATKGDLNTLGVIGHTVTPFRSDFTGQVLSLTGSRHWLADATVHDFDITRWGGGNTLGLLSAQLALKGNQDGYWARGPINSSGLNAGIFDLAFEGAYSKHVVWAKHIDITHHQSGAHVTGAGTITVVKNGPQLDLRGTWRDFRWPLIGKDVPFRSASGGFTLDGTWPYSVHMEGLATVRDLPPMPARVAGSLGKDRFAFNTLELGLYDGRAVLSGAAIWAPKQSWSVSGRVKDVNPGRLRDDLPGKLSFTIAAEGQPFASNGDFSVDIHDIGGRLRGVPASGGGKFARDAATWRFDEVRVALGRTNLALDGRLNDAFDLRFGLTAQDLSLVAPDSRGQLEAKGTIRGTLQAPTINAMARGSGLRHEGVTLDDFEANIDFDPDPQYDSKVDIHLHNLTFEDRKLENLAFKLDGRVANYAVRAEATGLGLAVTARANGPFANGTWTGRLDALTVLGTESTHLDLEQPIGLTVSADAVQAQWMCLVGKPASLCADGNWSPQQWDTTFTANEMPLGFFTNGLTKAVEYGGRINMRGRLFAAGQDPVQGALRVDLTDAQLAHRLSSGKIEHTTIGSGVVSVNASHTAVTGEVGLEAGEVGTIKGKLEAQRGAQSWQDMPLQGELHAHTEQLGLITLYVPDIDRAAGHLDADMHFGGTLGSPVMIGELQVSAGEIDYYQVNLGLRQLAFDAHLTDNGVDFNGSTRAGSGTATARGHLEWHKSMPYGKVQLEGTNLRVVDIPEAQIDASPTLEFNVDGRKIEVAGAVKVPFAKIVPTDLTGAVRPSSDEVIVGQEETDPSKKFEVVSTITLSLGDHVSVDTTGLTGRLTGNITVRSGYDEVTSGTGELSIEQGKYTAYARKLDIQRGRLIFTGGPIGNPGIDIKAIKEFPDVTAGVNVRGTLLQPRLSFFSDPSLTQSQIVSLILAGGSLESAQNRQTGAGNELLAQGGAILAQQLGSRVGIEDVSLEQDLTNETSLVLGRYLSPRLYVSYGISLTQQLNVLKLRYSLGDHWTVKTEVGQARGADLVYTIER